MRQRKIEVEDPCGTCGKKLVKCEKGHYICLKCGPSHNCMNQIKDKAARGAVASASKRKNV